jgi:gas vesicle protein
MAEATSHAPARGMSGMGAMVMAAGVGYVMGILLAPRSGRETRQKIGQKAEQAKSMAQDRLNEAKTRVRAMVKTASQRANTIREQGEEMVDEALKSQPDRRNR